MMKGKFLCAVVCCLVFAALPRLASAAYYIDSSTSGCASGDASYDPITRSCGAGSDTVFLSWNDAVKGVSAGTADSPTVVNVRSGTYREKITINKAWTTWRKHLGDATRPIVDGEWILPGAAWFSLIFTTSVGVTLDGIEVTRAGPLETGEGGVIGIWSKGDHTKIRNCFVHEITDAAIFVAGGTNVTVENNEVFEAGKCMLEDTCSVWMGAITIKGTPGPVTVRGNLVRGVGGEGIHPIQGAENVIIEGNTVYDTYRPGIYVHSSRDITIRHNLVYCTQNPRYARWRGSCGPGIRIAAEVYGEGWNTNHAVYGNMVAGTADSFSIAEIWAGASTPTNVKVFNNTFVNGMLTTLRIQNNRFSDTNQIRNNIFWQDGEGVLAEVPPGGATFSHNLWSSAPDPDARAPSDPTAGAGYPTLSVGDYLEKVSGWTMLKAGELTGKEFALRPGAPYGIDQGMAFDEPFNEILDLNASDFEKRVFVFADQGQNGSGWEIGADVVVEARCGDGTCVAEHGETCESCPEDCGSCPPVDGGPTTDGGGGQTNDGGGGQTADGGGGQTTDGGGGQTNDGGGGQTTDGGGGQTMDGGSLDAEAGDLSDDTAAGNSGCGCRAARVQAAPTWALALVLLLIARRRGPSRGQNISSR